MCGSKVCFMAIVMRVQDGREGNKLLRISARCSSPQFCGQERTTHWLDSAEQSACDADGTRGTPGGWVDMKIQQDSPVEHGSTTQRWAGLLRDGGPDTVGLEQQIRTITCPRGQRVLPGKADTRLNAFLPPPFLPQPFHEHLCVLGTELHAVSTGLSAALSSVSASAGRTEMNCLSEKYRRNILTGMPLGKHLKVHITLITIHSN